MIELVGNEFNSITAGSGLCLSNWRREGSDFDDYEQIALASVILVWIIEW